jgi:hypothetical protein
VTEILRVALQVCGSLLGGLLIYASLFLYESDQKRLQNRLEELWIRIDDRSKGADSASKSFATEISLVVERVFDRVFGPTLVSWRAVAVSSCFGIASLDLSLVPISDPLSRLAELILAAIYLILGMVPPITQRSWSTILAIGAWAYMVLRVPVDVLLHHRQDTLMAEDRITAALTVTLLPPLMDILWIYGCRALLKKAASDRTASLIFIWNAITIALCFLPMIGPLKVNDTFFTTDERVIPVWFVVVIRTFILTRWFLAICASLLLLFSAIAILHRYTWSALARVVYPLQRFNLVSKPKTLVGVGIAFIGLSSGATKWLEFVSKIADTVRETDFRL